MNYRHNANNVSLERRAPSVGIKSGSPAELRMNYPVVFPDQKSQVWKGET